MYQLNHPNIIKLYNHFEDDLSIYFVLEYAEKG
jgi:serine/threonine protein kinase